MHIFRTLAPISELFDAIAASPYRISPEVSVGLDAELEKLNITLEFTDKPKIYADYLISDAKVRLGVPFLSALWTAAHVYIVAFQEYQIAQRKGDRYFEFGQVPRVADAYSLYRDAKEAVASCKPFLWPLGAKKPLRYPFLHSDGHAANELFLVAIAWIIHHEIAHARLGHDVLIVTSIIQEIEADKSATQWICAGEPDGLKLHKKAMGMITAIVFLLGLDLEVDCVTTTTHPSPIERLINNLDLLGLGEDHMVYAFAFVLVDIHLTAKDICENINREGTFRDMCIDACLLLRSARSYLS